MACESWKAGLDTYVDGELSEDEVRAFEVHLRECASCAADALSRLQMKRTIQAAGRRFVATAEFRKQIEQNIMRKPKQSLRWSWTLPAVAFALVLATLALIYGLTMHSDDLTYSEIADLHVSALASSSPVDVVSSDRHTVKPWFQGKVPFTFDLPELQSSEFALLGGRVTYLDQVPGAQLIYQVRKHRISVFIFPEASLHDKLRLSGGTAR